MNNRVFPLLVWSVIFCFCSAISQSAAQAQGEPRAVSPDQGSAKGAMIRGWLLPAGDASEVALALKLAESERMVTLASTKDGAASSNPAYQPIPRGGVVEIELKAADQIISTQRLNLRADRSYTLIAWKEGGQWQIKAFADDLPSGNAPDRPLRVLNFIDGRKTQFFVGQGPGQNIPPSSIEEIRVAPKLLDLSIKVLDPGGGHPSQTSTAFDFSQADSAYVIVAPDYLGRADPRVVAGGRARSTPPSEEAAAAVPTGPEDVGKEKQRVRKLELEHRLAQLAALEANERGPNKIPNAAELKRKLEKEIRDLRAP